jgi:hypothetical protein
MKLLSKNESRLKGKKDNEDLIEQNIRLRKYLKDATDKLSKVLDDYGEEKLKRLSDFEKFCVELNEKKSKALKELVDIEKQIEKKKDIYYGFIEKSDALTEKIHIMQKKEDQLNLRENFVKELEKKQRDLIS